jgi:oligopeptide transport system ATP-binding protein
MYAGRIVEEGPVDAIFEAPQHPYTLGLLGSTPRLGEQIEALRTIPGQPPNLQALPPGCSFNDRCQFAFERCIEERPRLRDFARGRSKACHLERLS